MTSSKKVLWYLTHEPWLGKQWVNTSVLSFWDSQDWLKSITIKGPLIFKKKDALKRSSAVILWHLCSAAVSQTVHSYQADTITRLFMWKMTDSSVLFFFFFIRNHQNKIWCENKQPSHFFSFQNAVRTGSMLTRQRFHIIARDQY